MNYTNKQIEDLLAGIYSGETDVENLPEDLYLAIAKYLEKGLYDGFGGTISEFKLGGIDYELLDELRNNTYLFSGAKTYQQVREMSSIIADSENFSDFKEQALEIYDQYNVNWLQAEYNTAIGQASQARQWNEIEKNKETFPYLKYSAVIDDRTSDICLPLDGVILPVDDPLWDDYTPLNHFNCRCTLEQVDSFEEPNITPQEDVDNIKEGLDESVNDIFKMNAGKDGYIFSDEHPYFDVASKDKELAKRNFDLPLPKKK